MLLTNGVAHNTINTCMTVQIKFDEKNLKGAFGDQLKKQIKFAFAETLTNAAFDARRAALEKKQDN